MPNLSSEAPGSPPYEGRASGALTTSSTCAQHVHLDYYCLHPRHPSHPDLSNREVSLTTD